MLISLSNDRQHFHRCHNKRLHGKMSQVPSDQISVLPYFCFSAFGHSHFKKYAVILICGKGIASGKRFDIFPERAEYPEQIL